jgi:uncharacterized repeat protein (TIGR04042 family)
MPEMLFQVRWPDDAVTTCYSPSRAIASFLDAGTQYALSDFLVRSRDGLMAASERVRAMYGMPCSRAAGQLADIERRAAHFADAPDARVAVLSIEQA